MDKSGANKAGIDTINLHLGVLTPFVSKFTVDGSYLLNLTA
jgi:hypothetical protein